MPKVLVSDKLSPTAVQIFKDNGVEVDYLPDLGKDKDKKQQPKNEPLAAKPRTRTVPPAAKPRTRTVPPAAQAAPKPRKTLPKIPKLAPPAKAGKAGHPPPPPTAKARALSPPSRTKPSRTQPERSVSKTIRALSPGKLPPPPSLPRKKR